MKESTPSINHHKNHQSMIAATQYTFPHPAARELAKEQCPYHNTKLGLRRDLPVRPDNESFYHVPRMRKKIPDRQIINDDELGNNPSSCEEKIRD
ncbi:hypothetical protein KIN20_011402 [Parelaphostrongylus tenuis]|uniref:Uncharacterized protein n=1 Tax=Parelaphostrongylus tenuis TaxID=148309 RepID=A0AAD5QMG0_PARTN|nr:hypothetical protein KIN20_011402 [Parelaphostrongylus tenuis]